MTLKERVENNVALWLLGSLFTGFLAGIATYRGVIEIAKLEVVPRSQVAVPNKENPPTGATLPLEVKNEIQRLTEAHTQRLQALQAQLVEAEKGATYGGNLTSQQETYRQSSGRLGQAIKEQNDAYNAQVRSLRQLGTKQ